MNLKHFKLSEFDSPDQPGSGQKMKPSTLKKLDNARTMANIPFIINSGYRTRKHNKKEGGVFDSAHITGYAADIKAKTSRSRYLIVEACICMNFNRIGISSKMVHVDNDPTKPKNVLWTY